MSSHAQDTRNADAHEASIALSTVLGKNLRRLRIRRGHSLERLAKLSGVSRAMLGQIETGKSTPTIGLLWKVASALDVPFVNLLSTQETHGPVVLRRDQAKLLSSPDGQFTSRALFPLDRERRVEFYELRLAPNHRENTNAYAPATRANLIVVSGSVEIAMAQAQPIILGEGDAIAFLADVEHSYRNPGQTDAVLYLVISYVDFVG